MVDGVEEIPICFIVHVFVDSELYLSICLNVLPTAAFVSSPSVKWF